MTCSSASHRNATASRRVGRAFSSIRALESWRIFFGQPWQLLAIAGNEGQSMQRELNLIGGVTLPMVMHSAAEMRLVNSKTDAAYLSLRRCGFDQRVIAEHMPMDPGHLSRMIRGARPWSDNWQARFERLTGSYALTQWDCKARGGELYADPVETRKAALRAELQSLEKAA